MARVELIFCKAPGANYQGPTVPVIIGTEGHFEVITAASTADDVSQHAAADGENILQIISDADICFAIGENPEASVPAAGSVVAGIHRAKADVPTERYIQDGHKVLGNRRMIWPFIMALIAIAGSVVFFLISKEDDDYLGTAFGCLCAVAAVALIILARYELA